jgi:hypothetical protein
MLVLNLEQSPCSVAWPPVIAQIISFFAHTQPSFQPGA